MNSRRRQLDADHRKATEWAHLERCAICGRTPCEPCHYPSDLGGHHRGMGGGKAGWDLDEVWPGDRYCHDLVDGRLGVSKAVQYEREIALKRLERYRDGRNVDPTELA